MVSGSLKSSMGIVMSYYDHENVITLFLFKLQHPPRQKNSFTVPDQKMAGYFMMGSGTAVDKLYVLTRKMNIQ